MSGGSYEYLYNAYDLSSLLERIDILQRMHDRLDGLGYAEDAAAETEEILTILKGAERRIMRRIERLRGVWHDVEWWESCDYSEDQVKQGLAKYREEATS